MTPSICMRTQLIRYVLCRYLGMVGHKSPENSRIVCSASKVLFEIGVARPSCLES